MNEKGLVLDIHRFALHDGPGIRTTIFLKGCRLDCLWCHNPESIRDYPEIAYFDSICTACGDCVSVCPSSAQQIIDGVHFFNRELCNFCYRCTEACQFDALRKVGKPMTANEIMIEVEKDRKYYLQSGGGITISGGEPLLQPEFSLQILKAAKQVDIHTCIETSGFAPKKVVEEILPFVDLFLFDMKAEQQKHKALTGVSNKLILSNLELIVRKNTDIEIRCPLVPGLNNTNEFFKEIAEISARFQHQIPIRIMPYHNTGNGKLERYGYSPQLTGIESATDEQVSQWREELLKNGDLLLV
jgi:pyruvate formate lyase activating enzyme